MHGFTAAQVGISADQAARQNAGDQTSFLANPPQTTDPAMQWLISSQQTLYGSLNHIITQVTALSDGFNNIMAMKE